MTSSISSTRLRKYANQVFSLALILWFLLISLSFALNWRQVRSSVDNLALAEARATFNKDLAYRRWVSSQGGVYIQPSENTPPSPYLSHIPDRDIITESGKCLTLVNPAYMTRLVHELAREQYQIRGHITSLNPIRPENSPDPWEIKALWAFQSGAREVASRELLDGQPFMRLMRPMITETGCLKCHGFQGYQVGEIRGGISVSIPMDTYNTIAGKQMKLLLLGYGLVGLLGILGLVGARKVFSHVFKELSDSEARYHSLFESSPIAIWEADFSKVKARRDELLAAGVNDLKAHLAAHPQETRKMAALTRLTEVNQSSVRTFGVESKDRILRELYDRHNPESLAVFADLAAALAQGRRTFNGEFSLNDDSGDLIFLSMNAAVPESYEKNWSRVLMSFVDITRQKRTMEALREREARLEEAQTVARLGNWDWDIEGDNLFWSDEIYVIFGLNPREFGATYEAFLNSVHPDDREMVQKAVARALAGEAAYDLDHRIVLPDGTVRFVHEQAKVYRGRNGQPGRMLGIVQDITERKQTEQALAASENKFKGFAESSLVGLYLIQDWRLRYVNPKFAQLFGYSVEECLAKRSFRDFLHADDIERVVALVQKRLSGEAEFSHHTFRGVRKTGEIIHLEVFGSTVEYEGRLAALGTMVDITERKKAEESLLQRTRDLGERVRELDCLYGLARWLEDSGADSDSIIQGFAGTVPSGWQSPVSVCASIAVEGREFLSRSYRETPWRQSVDLLVDGNKAGDLTVCYLETYPELGKKDYLDSKQELITAIADRLARFLTLQKERKEREKLQGQLLQAQKMEAVGTLVGGISHDFNNLLQAINGYTQLLLMQKEDHDPDFHFLKAIQNAGDRSAELVRQLLLFSRKGDPVRQNLDLNQEVREACKILDRSIPKMIHIELHLDDDLWPVEANPIQLEQIILNLGTNASDAMPDGGRLLVETQNTALDEEYARTHLGVQPGDYVLMKVSDTGHGMNRETCEHIFEPFFTTKAVGKGTGLGLASVYGIVSSHQGHIMCYSEVGRGTSFQIYLPAALHKDESRRDRPAEAPLIGGTETILLVDDDEAIREFAHRVLERFGYNILMAASGEEALEVYAAKGGSIDLIVMDIGMPGMGGYQCLGEILRRNPAALVVIASGYSMDGIVQKTLEAGAAGYLGKPYQMKNLLNTVRAILDQKEKNTDSLQPGGGNAPQQPQAPQP